MKCCIGNCEKAARARGLCTLHYGRMMAGRDLSGPTRIVVRSGSDIDRLKSKVSISQTGCWEWTASLTEAGYGQMRFRGTRELSHRVAWILFRGEIPTDSNVYGTKHVLHTCDNPKCVNPEHLYLGDQQDNALDSVSRKRWGKRGCKGESHGRAKLNDEDVRLIRSSAHSDAALSSSFSVSIGTIRHIRKGRTWKHIL
jgi:hypothetical protein